MTDWMRKSLVKRGWPQNADFDFFEVEKEVVTLRVVHWSNPINGLFEVSIFPTVKETLEPKVRMDWSTSLGPIDFETSYGQRLINLFYENIMFDIFSVVNVVMENKTSDSDIFSPVILSEQYAQ